MMVSLGEWMTPPLCEIRAIGAQPVLARHRAIHGGSGARRHPDIGWHRQAGFVRSATSSRALRRWPQSLATLGDLTV
jgi:hypothetical protein